MPAHISHVLFAEDAAQEAIGGAAEELLAKHGNVFRFGAQGPDFFYHNQRTRPLGVRYGRLIHRRGFGSVIAAMARVLLDSAGRNDSPVDAEAAAYLLGFATHAELDRYAHPYIISRSGWVRVADDATRRFHRCHTFLERLLDVVALRARRGVELPQYDFFSGIYCGESLPYQVIKMLLKGINQTYPDTSYKSRDRRRIENAYGDTIGFYTFTDHRNPQLRRRAFELDRREGYRRRRIAVYHFPEVADEVDAGNDQQRPWLHPCDPQLMSTASYMELFTAAGAALVPRLRRLWQILDQRLAADELATLFGNQSLNATLDEATCTPQAADPLPLPEVFDRLYASAAPAGGSDTVAASVVSRPGGE